MSYIYLATNSVMAAQKIARVAVACNFNVVAPILTYQYAKEVPHSFYEDLMSAAGWFWIYDCQWCEHDKKLASEIASWERLRPYHLKYMRVLDPKALELEAIALTEYQVNG